MGAGCSGLMECEAWLQEGQGNKRKKRQQQEGPAFSPVATGENVWGIQRRSQTSCSLFYGAWFTYFEKEVGQTDPSSSC